MATLQAKKSKSPDHHSPELVRAQKSVSCPLCGAEAKPRFPLGHTTAFQCQATGCRLQFASPQISDEELGHAYELLYYPSSPGRPPVLENAPEFEVRSLLRIVESKVGTLAGKRILDYGCGNGLLLRIAVEKGAQATGLEASATARARIHDAGFATAYSSIEDLLRNAPSATFDCILMCDVVEHLRVPWQELANLRSLLSPGGKTFLTTPNCESLRSRLSGSKWDQRRNLTHFYYFSPKSLSNVLKRAGFQEIGELAPITTYSHHGPFRRWFQRSLASCGLQGGLIFMAGH